MAIIDPFESPKLLIDRAKENYTDFTAKRRAFFNASRTFPFTEPDLEAGQDVYKIRFEGEIPGNIRTAASDTLNNLRHALDQAVHASRTVLNPSATKQVYFPICKDVGDIDDVIKTKCFGVHPDIIAYMKSLKPYLGGDDLLWALCRIAGPNKHQIVLGVGIKIHPTSYDIHIVESFGSGEWGGFIRCGDKNEWEVARMAFGSKLNFNYRTTSYITFASGEVVAGEVVSRLLDEHISKVESIVLGLESETARLKVQGPV